MAGVDDIYTSTMLGRFGYLATWFPGTSVIPGLLGIMEGKTFVPKSSIRSLGVRFRTETNRSPEGSLQFASAQGIGVQPKVKGTVLDIAPTIPKVKAGVAVTFGKETGVVFSARGLTVRRVADVLALEKAIWDLWDRFLWNESWVVVTEVLAAAKATILISGGGGAKVELQAQVAAQVGPVDIGDLAAGFKLVSSYGMHTQIVGERGLTPLFRAIRVRDSFWRKTRIEGVRAVGPPPRPGVVPRRGVERPAGDMTEAVA